MCHLKQDCESVLSMLLVKTKKQGKNKTGKKKPSQEVIELELLPSDMSVRCIVYM